MREPILEITGLSKTFCSKSLFGHRRCVYALKNIHLAVYAGETLAVVGESGSGKTTLGRIILGTVAADSGMVVYRGNDLLHLKPKERRRLQQNIQMVFQDPYSSLNPRLSVKTIVAEPLLLYKSKKTRQEIRAQVSELLCLTGLNDTFLDRYPANMSGGQRQRIGIARCLAAEPEFIILDEPTSSLDVSVQAQILNVLIDIKRKKQATYLFISHNLAAVRYIADRVCVLYQGSVCELDDADELYERPKHPYTEYLLSCIPKIGFQNRTDVEDVLPVEKFESGCPFCNKCKYRLAICSRQTPEKTIIGTAEVYCFNPIRYDED
ncbi:MAG: ATP-binding cassette domain-containing protein [Treponema sp.]